MKYFICLIFLTLSQFSWASQDVIENTLGWFQSLAPQNIEFKVEKSAIKFSGCKQKEYFALFNQPISNKMVLEMGLGYAKGKHTFGAYNQKVSVKQLSFIPRYQVSHAISFGIGLIAQSKTEFKNTQGVEFDLPENTQWVMNTRIQGFAKTHYWEWTASSQKWRASRDLSGTFARSATDNKIGFSYNGYF
ncbi:hypothetical protein [Paraglaciecola aestuariivivens]